MLNILIGTVSGVVSAMGMGGGTILILCLSLFLGKDQHIAQGANLIFFIPTALVSIFINIKQKLIKWKTGLTVGFFGIIRCNYWCKNISWFRYKQIKIVFSEYFCYLLQLLKYILFLHKKKQNKSIDLNKKVILILIKFRNRRK